MDEVLFDPLNGAPRVDQPLGRDVCRVRFLGIFERPKVDWLSIDGNSRYKPVFFLMNTKISGLVVGVRRALVLCVDRSRRVAKVFYSVVPGVAVDVVDVTGRHRAVVPQPNKSVSLVLDAADLDVQVSAINVPGHLALPVWAHLVGLDSDPGVILRAVMKGFLQLLKSDSSHDISSLKTNSAGGL